MFKTTTNHFFAKPAAKKIAQYAGMSAGITIAIMNEQYQDEQFKKEHPGQEIKRSFATIGGMPYIKREIIDQSPSAPSPK